MCGRGGDSGSQQGAYTTLRNEWTGAPSITKVTNLGN